MAQTAAEPQCRACLKTPATSDDSIRFLVCSRCHSLTQGQRKTYYCSKACQTLDWPLHKATICGQPPLEPSPPDSNPTATSDLEELDTSNLSPALLFHLAALKTLSPQLSTPFSSSSSSSSSTSTALHPTPAYLFFPTSPLVATSSKSPEPLPIPIHLSRPSHKLFTALFHTAIKTSNSLSLTLMYSLLVTSIEALRGGEPRLVRQLGEEFPGVDVRKQVEMDEEPTEVELKDAIGGQENLPLLLEWQMEEAERLRQQ